MHNKKYNLIGAGIFTLVLVLLLMFMPRAAISDEKVDETTCNDKTTWSKKEWCNIVEYQKVVWKKTNDYLSTKEVHPNLIKEIDKTVKYQDTAWKQGNQQNADNLKKIKSVLGINE